MSQSLNSRIDLVAAARLLGVKLDSHSLPAGGNCPTCSSGRVHFYQDTVTGGAWSYCRFCESSGDFIDLVMQKKRCNPASAVNELQLAGALPLNLNPRPLLKQWASHKALRSEVDSLLQKSMRGGRVTVDHGAISVLSNAQMRVEPNLTWNADGNGKLLGVADMVEIEDAFRPRRDTAPKRYVPRDPRVTPDKNGNAIILPFWEAPGLIGSITMLDVAEQPRYHSYDIQWVGQPVRGTGLAYHPQTLNRSQDNQLLLTADPDFFVRLQTKHLNKSAKPLPIVAYRNGDNPTRNWQPFSGRRFTFWTSTVTAELLWMAIDTDSSITMYGPKSQTVAEFLRQRDPVVVVEKCFRNAKPWQEVIARLVATKDAVDLADFVGQMNLSAGERDRVLMTCDRDDRDKLQRAFDNSVEYRTVPVKQGYVEQRSSGWYHVRPGDGEHLITNAPFKILEAVSSSSGRIDYRVEAELNRHKITFDVDHQTFHKDPFDVVHRQAVLAGAGVPAFDTSWRSQAVNIATQLHVPSTKRYVSRVGFNELDRVLVLPRLTISTLDGRLSTEVRGEPNLPGFAITDACVDWSEVSSLMSDPNCVTPLSVLMAGTGQVAASCLLTEPHSVGLLGRSAFNAAADVAKLLGIAVVGKRFSDAIDRRLQQHDWPTLISNTAFGSVASTRQYDAVANTNMLWLSVNHIRSAYHDLIGSSTTVRSRGYSPMHPSLLSSLAPLFVHTLRDLFRHNRKGTLNGPHGPSHGVFLSLRRMFKKHAIDTKYLDNAIRACDFSPSPTASLIRMIHATERAGSLYHSHDKSELKKGGIYYSSRHKSYYVSKASLTRAMVQSGLPHIDMDDLLLRVTNSPNAYELTRVDKTLCWKFSESEFNHQRRTVARQSKKLRLISA